MFLRNRYKIKRSMGDIEPHEVFLDRMAHKKEEELGLSEKKLEVPLKDVVAHSLFFIFLLLASVLFAKIFYFQVLLGKQLQIQSENNKGSVALIRPARGIVYDRNGKKLVYNSAAADLLCDKRKLPENPYLALKQLEGIASALKANPIEIENKFDFSQDPQVLVSENLSQEALLVLETKINDLPACSIESNIIRDYPLAEILSPVLGYTGRINSDELGNMRGYAVNDLIGKTGLEKSYESYLRGTPGVAKSNKNSNEKAETEPVSGENLVLNLDLGLQTALYNSLEKSLKNVGAKKGAAVVMDPRTGAVLSMVSFPSYDNNLFAKGISVSDYQNLTSDPNQPMFNRAVAAKYPTGSTIKPFEASGALQEKIISPDKLINDPGYILVHSQYDYNVTYRYGGVTPHGLVDMRKALAVSSNIYFYTIGGGYENQQGLGPTRIKKYLSLFGWGQKTGIDLPGEVSGFIPTPEWKKQTKKQPWWDGDTYNLAIGQSDLMVTPLQVANAYSVIANGGILYKPQLVSKIIDNNKSIIKEFKPEIIRQGFIDLENLQVIREGMRDGVTKPYGLSAMLNDLPVSVAAKTGTAETGVANQFNVWSAAFAPYENPEIVIVVTVENVKGFGAVTLPVAHDVLQYYFSEK